MRRRRFIAALALVALVASPALADAGTAADEASFFDWIRTFWPIVVVAGGIIVAGVMAGLSIRFVSSARFDGLKDRVDRIEAGCNGREIRVSALEEAGKSSPTRSELQEDVGEVSERLARVEASLGGIHGSIQTTNTYLHTLIERGLAA